MCSTALQLLGQQSAVCSSALQLLGQPSAVCTAAVRSAQCSVQQCTAAVRSALCSVQCLCIGSRDGSNPLLHFSQNFSFLVALCLPPHSIKNSVLFSFRHISETVKAVTCGCISVTRAPCKLNKSHSQSESARLKEKQCKHQKLKQVIYGGR